MLLQTFAKTLKGSCQVLLFILTLYKGVLIQNQGKFQKMNGYTFFQKVYPLYFLLLLMSSRQGILFVVEIAKFRTFFVSISKHEIV